MLLKEFEKWQSKVFQKLYFVQKYLHIIHPKECLNIFDEMRCFMKEVAFILLYLIYFCQNKHYIYTENLKKYIGSWEIYLIHQICCMKTFTSTIYTQEAS